MTKQAVVITNIDMDGDVQVLMVIAPFGTDEEAAIYGRMLDQFEPRHPGDDWWVAPMASAPTFAGVSTPGDDA